MQELNTNFNVVVLFYVYFKSIIIHLPFPPKNHRKKDWFHAEQVRQFDELIHTYSEHLIISFNLRKNSDIPPNQIMNIHNYIIQF